MADYYDEIYDDPSSQLLAELEGAAKISPTIYDDEVRSSATPYNFTPVWGRFNNNQTGSHHSNARKDTSGDDYTNSKRDSQEHIDRVNKGHNNSTYYDYIDGEDEMFQQSQPSLRGGEAPHGTKTEPQDVVQDGERFGDRDVFVEEDEDEYGDAGQEIIQNDQSGSDAEDGASQMEDDDVEMENADKDARIGRIGLVGYVSRMGDIGGLRRAMSHVSDSPELGEETIKAEEPNGVMSDSEDPASERDEMDEDEQMEYEDEVDDNSEAQSDSDSKVRNENRESSHRTNEDHDNGNGHIRCTGQESAVPGSIPEPQPPVDEIKKQYKGDKNLHDKARAHCALRVDTLSGRGRYLVAVLDHRVEPKDVRKERDFLWIKGNEVCLTLSTYPLLEFVQQMTDMYCKNNTVETIWHTYQNATAEAEFDLWTHNEIPDRKDQLKELNFYYDKVVVFRARKKEDLSAKGFKNAPIVLD